MKKVHKTAKVSLNLTRVALLRGINTTVKGKGILYHRFEAAVPSLRS